MDKKQRSRIWVGIATLVLLTLVVIWIFHGHYQEILQNICTVQIWELLLLLILGFTYQVLEGSVCRTLVGKQLPSFSLWQAIDVTFLGVFGNVSTSAAGTIPMQCYYLHHYGFKAGNGVSLMTLEYVFHKSSVLLYATILLTVQGDWLRQTGMNLFRYLLLGYIICALIIVTLLLLCAWSKVQDVACRGIDHLPSTEKWEMRKVQWKEQLRMLHSQSQYLLQDRKCMRRVIALNFLKLFCLYSILFVCLRALKVSVLSFWRIQLLASLMYLISNALPNISGMGSIEFAFMMIFSRYMEYAQASSALVLYRIATFFFPFLISIFVFLSVQKRVLHHTW